MAVCTGAGLEAGWFPTLQQRAGNPRVQNALAGMLWAADHASLIDQRSPGSPFAGDVHAEGNPHQVFAPALTWRLGPDTLLDYTGEILRHQFAFVLVYLAPLFLIALLHDLISSERHCGRLGTLLAMPGVGRSLWLRRAGLRTALVLFFLTIPMLRGAVFNGSPAASVAAVLLATVAYLAFWCGLALFVAAQRGSSAAHASALMGCWVVLTLLLPTLANAALARAAPVTQGVELMLAQRQSVHGAWDQPREQTLERFFRTHPQWQDTEPLPRGFHWKWYYAFQQLGDESVATQVAAYRDGLIARQRWTERLGWLLPAVGVQAALHRQADTDLLALLAYQDRIADYHRELRTFFYSYLFQDLPFGPRDFAAQPRFEPQARSLTVPLQQLLVLTLAGALALLLGAGAAGRTWATSG